MDILKKIALLLSLGIINIPQSSLFALTLTESVNSIQATDSTLPTGVSNPKGSIGALLAELFWGMGDGIKNGKIKPQYIDYSGISAWTQSGSDVFTSGTGNVGIGVNNPSAKLEVAGQIKITGGSPGNGKVLVSNASGLASWSLTAPLYSYTESDPVWSGVSGNYYTKTNLQTSGQSSVHWGNLTNTVVANGFAPGILSIADWNTFNNKIGFTSLSATSPLTYNNATGVFGIGQASTSTNGYLSSADWNTFNGKQNALTGAATTIVSNDLTASRALVSDASGKVGTSATTSAELSYLTGTTSNIQAQMNSKAPLVSPIFTGTPIAPTATTADSSTTIATTAFVKNQGYLSSYSESDPQVGGNTLNYLPKWNGSALVTSGLYESGGNVGIGTGAPGYKLDIVGTTRTAGEIISINANTNRIIQGNYGIFDRNDGVTYYKLITASGDQYGTWNSLRPLSINITSGDVGIGNSAIYVQHGANVGIGTINPGYKLDVNGDARIDGLYIGQGSGSVSSNTAVGYQALQTNSTGSSNSAFGYRALYSNTTGYYNTAIGRSALYSNTEGIYNTAIGYSSLSSNTTGDTNSAVGYSALYSNTTGRLNTAIGVSTLRKNTEGIYNTAIGNSSLILNTKGNYNTALGVGALHLNSIGNGNVGIGVDTGRMLGGAENIFIGDNAGDTSVNLGYSAGTATATANTRRLNISPALNLTLVPAGSTVSISFTGTNSISGLSEIALFNVINGTTLELNSEYSGSYGTTGSATIDGITKVNPSSGDYRVIIGRDSGTTKGGGNNTILIGSDVEAVDTIAPNQLNIGNWIYGSGGNIGIGDGTPRGEKLAVAGNAIISGGYVFMGNQDGATNLNNDFVHYDDTNNILFGGFDGSYSFINDLPRETTWTGANSLVAAGGGYFAKMIGIDGATNPSASLEIKRTTADGNFAAWIEGSNAANFGIGVNVAGTTSATAIADFKSGNTSRLFVRADGKIGIGTSTPAHTLDIVGNVNMTGNVGIGTGTPTSTKGVNVDIDMVNNSGMGLYSNLTASGTFTAARTNYGTYNIVTNLAENGAHTNTAYGAYNYALNTSPATGTGARNIYGTYSYARNNIATGSITNAYGGYFTVGNSTGSIANGYGVYIGNVDGNATTTYGLYQSDSAGKNYFAGSVGIGNNAPSASFEVKRTVADANFATWIEGSNAANFGIGVNVAGTTSATAIADFKSGNTSRLFVRADGNVGIGTTSPAMGLEVSKNNGYGYAALFRKDATSQGVGLGTYNGASGISMIQGLSSSGTAANLGLQTNGGNIGVGTSTPSQKLEVDGNIKTSGGVIGTDFGQTFISTMPANMSYGIGGSVLASATSPMSIGTYFYQIYGCAGQNSFTNGANGTFVFTTGSGSATPTNYFNDTSLSGTCGYFRSGYIQVTAENSTAQLKISDYTSGGNTDTNTTVNSFQAIITKIF